jgi:hypothetical protein
VLLAISRYIPCPIHLPEVKEDEMGRTCIAYGEQRNAYRILMGKAEGKKPLGRPRHRWEENIKMDLR